MVRSIAARSLSSTLRTVGCWPICPISRWPDRGVGHERLHPKFAQGVGHFLHFGGAALAMDRHALQIVGHDLGPIEPGIIISHRYRDLIDDAGARGGKKALQRERLDAFDHDAAHRLDRCRGADLDTGDAGTHASAARIGATAVLAGPASSKGV